MRKLLLFFVLIIFVQINYGQDTIVVQTLNFDSITARRGTWVFPDSTHNFRKILMQYTLKCDAATTQDGYACGEWDYLTYTNVYDHTGELDSIYSEHAQFMTGSSSPEQINTATTTSFSIYQEEQYDMIIDSVLSENELTIGSGLLQMEFGEMKDGRAQFFWSDSVLSLAGLAAGNISGIKLNIQNAGTELFSLKIKMKSSNLFNEGNFDSNSLIEVYNKNTSLTGNGWHRFNFHTPFYWDGNTGLLIEFSYDNSSEGINAVILGSLATDIIGSQPTDKTGVYSSGSDNCLKIYSDNFVLIPTNNLSGLISDEITISFWQYGDPNVQPQSDYIFEAYDGNNKRVLGCHLPWSNGSVYWDAGNTGSSYDRINKQANTEDYEGRWNHWALTKNSVTGYMRIYLNGEMWHFGNAKTLSMTGIEKFVIGSSANEVNFYDGKINEFRIWNKELPDSVISGWMNKKIDNTHPFYNNLICYYDFDSVPGYLVPDVSGITGDGLLMGSPMITDVSGEGFYMNPENTNYLPNIKFLSGDYISSVDTLISNDTIYNSPVSVVEFAIGSNSVSPVDTAWYLLGGWNNICNPLGLVVDSIFFPYQTQINNSVLQYYLPPYEVVNMYEIGRFITPYGIGLDLGPQGFTWVYDVTDYAPLLVDSVDLSAGNQQELVDIKFIMIEGTPAREVKGITRIWGQRASYSFNQLDNDNKLSNKKIGLLSGTESYKVKTRLTGHGHNSSSGNYPHCCEWWDNTHYLLVNSDTVNQWHIWQTYDCAQNPVYPQGGTWPGAREGWCPGDKVKDNEFEITEYITGDSVDIDYEISDVPAFDPAMGGGNYVVAMQLIQYGETNFINDAEIVDVISPNKFGYYSRENPVCNNPKVLIRNSGSDILTTLQFEYSVSGGSVLTYSWTGSLAFMEQEIVVLPVVDASFWQGDDTNIFNVNISEPNGGLDQNTDNDVYNCEFILPHIYADNFIIMYRSNNLPQENYYEVTDMDGNVVFSRYEATASTLYYDTLNLLPGCYTLNLYDTGADGLSYWAYPEQGSGFFKIKKIGGGTLKIFEPEFGYNIMYAFTIGDYTSVTEISNETSVEIFPNPANEFVNVDVSGFSGEIRIQLIDFTGRILSDKKVYSEFVYNEKIDVGRLSNGAYLIKVFNDKLSTSKSVIINH